MSASRLRSASKRRRVSSVSPRDKQHEPDLLFQERVRHAGLGVEDDEVRAGLTQRCYLIAFGLLRADAEDEARRLLREVLDLTRVAAFDDQGVRALLCCVLRFARLVRVQADDTEHRRLAGGGSLRLRAASREVPASGRPARRIASESLLTRPLSQANLR